MEDDKTLRSKIITGVSFGVLVFITFGSEVRIGYNLFKVVFANGKA